MTEARPVVLIIGARGGVGKAQVIQAVLTEPVAVEEAVADTVAHFGAIEVLAHCAGAYTVCKPIRALRAAEWTSFLDADLTGFFHVFAACVRHMHERKKGVIVAVSSIVAQACQPRGGQAAAAKAGLDALVRVVAKEEGRHNIRANAVSIGLTATEMVRTPNAPGARKQPNAGSRARRSAGWASRKRLRASSGFSLRTRQAMSPARCCRSMAAR